MASGNFVLDKGYDAEGAIAKYTAVKKGTGAQAVTKATSPSDIIRGVSQFGVTTNEIAKGKGCSVRMAGITPWVAGESLSADVEVTIDSNGKAVAAGEGDRVYGSTLTAGDTDEYVSVNLSLPGYILNSLGGS